jgi:hypothetical protein
MKKAFLYPIPKSNGLRILDKMRPITLLEIGYKLTTGWIAFKIRKLAASAPTPLWHANQYGGNGGTHEALLRFIATLEDANECEDPSLIACLADVEAAYDSVSADSKALAYRRAGMPEAFIRFSYDLDTHASTRVLVQGCEPAEGFEVLSGFRQGDPLSVIGWLLFINPVITWIQDDLPPQAAPHTYYPPRDSPQAQYNGPHKRRDHLPVTGAYTLKNQGGPSDPLFYMDDAGFLPKTRRALVTYLERFSLYLQFHDVHTHPTKTICTGSASDPAGLKASPPAVFTHNT